MGPTRFDIKERLDYKLLFDFPYLPDKTQPIQVGNGVHYFRDAYRLMDGTYISFNSGTFNVFAAGISKASDLDNFVRSGANFYVALATDTVYFDLLRFAICELHVPMQLIWPDVWWIYHNSWLEANPRMCRAITDGVVRKYSCYGAETLLEPAYMQLYYGFIAENYYPGTYMGAKIKINGVWELFDSISAGRPDVYSAANDSRSSKDRVGVARQQCLERGIPFPSAIVNSGIDYAAHKGLDYVRGIEARVKKYYDVANILEARFFNGKRVEDGEKCFPNGIII